jgi:DNA-binding GntR family transcriptional regulator
MFPRNALEEPVLLYRDFGGKDQRDHRAEVGTIVRIVEPRGIGDLLDEAQRVDSDLHDLLSASTGNESLIQAYSIDAIRVRMIRLDRISLNPVVLTPSLSGHIEIIDAILARDGASAITATETHIANARNRAVSF